MKQVRFIADNFINDAVPNPIKGQVRALNDAVADHLVGLGMAVYLKVEAPVQVKKDQPTSVSQAAPASLETTAPRRRGRPKKL